MDLTVQLHGFDTAEATVQLADEPPPTVRGVLQALDIPTETVVVFLDDAPVPVEEPVSASATVRIVRIVSGG